LASNEHTENIDLESISVASTIIEYINKAIQLANQKVLNVELIRYYFSEDSLYEKDIR